MACKRFIFSILKDSLDLEHEEKRRNRPDSWRVWLASAGSITVIATCEVFAVLVVPIMQRVFYQHINQFLIALAIGSLLGNDIIIQLVISLHNVYVLISLRFKTNDVYHF